jgi:hypothetical protein
MAGGEYIVCSKAIETVHVNEWKTSVSMVQDQHEQWGLKSV